MRYFSLIFLLFAFPASAQMRGVQSMQQDIANCSLAKAELTEQVFALTKERDELRAQIEKRKKEDNEAAKAKK
jgi:hypothetical protein